MSQKPIKTRSIEEIERSAEILGPDSMDGLMIYYTPQGTFAEEIFVFFEDGDGDALTG